MEGMRRVLVGSRRRKYTAEEREKILAVLNVLVS
jgi:hypothetical protein